MSTFGEATGGQRAGRVAALVVLGLWLALSGLVVFLVTALGLGSCSTDACAERATLSFFLIPAIHVLALSLGAWIALRRTTVGKRTLLLVVIAVATPVLSLTTAFQLVSRSA